MVSKRKVIRSKKFVLDVIKSTHLGRKIGKSNTARFLLYTKQGKVDGSTGCHAGLNMGPDRGIKLVISQIQSDYGTKSGVNYNSLTNDERTCYLNFLFHHSNFKDAWLINDEAWSIKHGLLVNDTRAMGWQIGAACVMGRHIHEKAWKVRMFHSLVEAGISDLNFAFLLVHRIKQSDDGSSLIQYTAATSHATVPANFSKIFLKNYLKGCVDDDAYKGCEDRLPNFSKPYEDSGTYAGFSGIYGGSSGDDLLRKKVSEWFGSYKKGAAKTKPVNPFAAAKVTTDPPSKRLPMAGITHIVSEANKFIKELLDEQA